MKIDFLEILGGAFETLVGRIAAVALSIHLGAGFGGFIGTLGQTDLETFLACFLFGILVAAMGIFSIPGMIIAPILFGFTILFTRYEWSFKLLAIPFVLSAYLGWNLSM